MSYETEHRTEKAEDMLKRKMIQKPEDRDHVKTQKWLKHRKEKMSQARHSTHCLGTHTVEYSRPKPLWEPLRTPRETLGLEYSTV